MPDIEQVRRPYASAKEAAERGSHEEALTLLAIELVTSPGSAPGWYALGGLQLQRKLVLDSRESLKRCSMLASDDNMRAALQSLSLQARRMRPIPYYEAPEAAPANISRNLRVLADRRKKIVLVYQAGRVGSTALQEQLQRRLPSRYVGHHHVISEEGCRRARQGLSAFAQSGNGNLRHAHGLRVSLQTGELVRQKLEEAIQTGRQVDIVTVARDPLEHELSNFFFHLPILFPYWQDIVNFHKSVDFFCHWFVNYLDTAYNKDRESAATEALRSDASKYAFIISGGIDSWFSRELNALLQIDLDGLGFSGNAPYAISRHPWGNLLTLRFEKMQTCAGEALSEMFGFPAENLKTLNTSNERVSRAFRDEFMKRISVPDELKDNIFGTKYARYFYPNA
jgi:hypothetical protein